MHISLFTQTKKKKEVPKSKERERGKLMVFAIHICNLFLIKKTPVQMLFSLLSIHEACSFLYRHHNSESPQISFTSSIIFFIPSFLAVNVIPKAAVSSMNYSARRQDKKDTNVAREHEIGLAMWRKEDREPGHTST
jgi:hypothetical protein